MLAVIILFLCSALAGFVCQETVLDSEQKSGDQNGNHVLFMTVSSVQSTIELNWKFTDDNPPDVIKLYTTASPPNENTKPTITLDVTNYLEGFYITEIPFEYSFPEEWKINEEDYEEIDNFSAKDVIHPIPGPHCLNYWIAAFKNNKIVQKSCYTIKPTWMSDNREKIGNIPLKQLFIPGTHNSACYDPDLRQRKLLKKSVHNFLYTQDTSIWDQMIFGIRYFDFRIAFYNSSLTPNSFWINHDLFKITRLIPLLREIKTFLNKAQNEILILDLHRFPVGFKTGQARHKLFVELLHREIGDIAIPRAFQKSPSLNDIWRQNRRLIICYGEKAIAQNSEYLWDPLKQMWGDEQTIHGLKQYLKGVNLNPPSSSANPLWAAMAELTPNHRTVLLGILSHQRSLSRMADEVNRNVTSWYREDWCDKANIVATDFFLGNDLSNVAINCNLRKAN